MTTSQCHRASGGFSLIEVLIASVILGVGLLAVLSGIVPCLAVVTSSRRYQEVRWVMGLGQLKHPLTAFEELEDLEVEEDDELADEDSTLGEGYVFSRKIDEKTVEEGDDDDGLFVLRTQVRWGEGADDCEEIVQLVYKKDGGSYPP